MDRKLKPRALLKARLQQARLRSNLPLPSLLQLALRPLVSHVLSFDIILNSLSRVETLDSSSANFLQPTCQAMQPSVMLLSRSVKPSWSARTLLPSTHTSQQLLQSVTSQLVKQQMVHNTLFRSSAQQRQHSTARLRPRAALLLSPLQHQSRLAGRLKPSLL